VIAAIGGRPFLQRVVDPLVAAGARRVVLALGHLAEQVEAVVDQWEWEGVEIIRSTEQNPAGTGGALRLARPHLRADTILVANGDSFVDVDHRRFVDFHRSHGALISVLLAPAEQASRFGTVRMGEDDAITAFEEKPTVETGEGYVSAGVYLVECAVIDAIPANQSISLEYDMFPQYSNGGLYGMRQDQPFIDIGVPESLERAEAFFDELEAARKPT
jgi:NDP-sugar pyrophosphorylase family protein